MYIKGFNKDLQCRGYQFEVGKEYKIETDKALELCSSTVFHFCDSLQKTHKHYSADNENNRFCEIAVLGEIVSDTEKMGSNHIKILREITGDELNILKGKINGNTGLFNSGHYNSGYYNSGDCNSGDCNSGDYNSGDYNSGYCNSGHYNSGDYNSGDYNSGDRNSGHRNSGYYNSGDYNSGDYNSGDRNSGHRNSGYYNSGDYNSGDYNSCHGSNGVFCTISPKISIFNTPTDMTLMDFRNSKYAVALYSAPFILCEWVSDAEKTEGGYLKQYTYKEACANWWAKMTEKNKEVVKSMPNFNPEIFKDITGIEV